MRFLLSTTVLASLAAVGLAAPATHYEVHEKRGAPPHAWDRHSSASPDQVLPVRIGLKQRNLEHAERFLNDVAHPSSPNFGKHWSAEQVANTFAPTKESIDTTVDWLVSSGIDRSRIKHSKGRCV